MPEINLPELIAPKAPDAPSPVPAPHVDAKPKHDDNAPKDKPHVVGEKPKPLNAPKSEYDTIYEYPDKMELAAKTGHALDRSLMNLSRLYMGDGEIRRQSWFRSTLPLIGGISVGLTPFASIADKLGAGALLSVFSPIAGYVRRLTGENAFTQFARFANRREDTGIIGRFVRGAESRVMKRFFLSEDRDTRQLLRLYDQGVDNEMLNGLNLGSKNRIDNLITAGYMGEMKAQMIAELDIKLSKKEMDKTKRLHDAYEMAKRVYENKIPTLGQKQLFINDTLPSLLQKKERELWAKQQWGLLGVGAAKTAGAMLVGQMIGSGLVTSVAAGIIDHTSKIIGGAISALPTGAGIQSWINANMPNFGPPPPSTLLTPVQVPQSVVGGPGDLLSPI